MDNTQQYRKALLSQKQPLKETRQVEQFVDANITQLQTVQQRFPSICGFHLISNLMEFDPNNPHTLTDQHKFIDNYYLIRNYLIGQSTNPKEIQQLQKYGQMQRTHIELLVKNKQSVPWLAGKHIGEFTFGFNYIQNSEESLQRLQHLVKEFKLKNIQRLYIVLGVTVHWSLLVVDNPHNPHMFYMDSLNYSLKTIMGQHYVTLPSDKQWRSYFQDLKSSVKILQAMVFKDVDIPTIKFENQLSQMLLSFAMVNISSKEEISKWFADEYHPVVIKNDVFEPMMKCDYKRVNPVLLKEFKKWVQTVHKLQVFDVSTIKSKLQQV